jgi:hypothetical protein
MTLAEHARRELEMFETDQSYIDWMVSVIEKYSAFDHSDGSHSIAAHQLARLLDGGNLMPLTDDPAEWEDRSEISGYPIWQNKRNSRAFSRDGGKTYYYVDIRTSSEMGEFDSVAHT